MTDYMIAKIKILSAEAVLKVKVLLIQPFILNSKIIQNYKLLLCLINLLLLLISIQTCF